MNTSPSLQTPAWLLRGIRSVPGTLRLANGRLSFAASDAGNLSSRQRRILERDTGRDGLAARLNQGLETVVFDVPLSDVHDVRVPWYYVSGGLKLTVRGVPYRFGFDPPANTRGSAEGADLWRVIAQARRRGAAWKAVLMDR